MNCETVKILQLNKLNAETREIIYKRLLSEDYISQISIDIGVNKPNIYNVDVEFSNNDCCISSWGLNFYIRTNKAVKAERYKTFGHCLKALKELAKTKNIKIVSNLRIYKKINFRYDDGPRGTYKCHLFSIEL